jgi:transcriptional repressor NrdR
VPELRLPLHHLRTGGNGADHRDETFNRSKLLHGLLRACEKTGLEPARLESVVDDIELQLQQRSGREVKSAEIGEMVLEQLSGMSEVAYVRFASVYRQFQGVADFVATLEGLNRRVVNRVKQAPVAALS